MKKTAHALAVPVVLLLAVGVAACGGDVPVGTTPGATGAPTSGAQETPGSGGGTPTDTPTSDATAAPGTGGGDRESGVAAVSELQVGDCYTYVNTGGTPDFVPIVVELVSCDSPHLDEVFYKTQIDDSKYTTVPTEDEILAETRSACRGAFEGYVGIDRDSSSYLGHAYHPSAESWAQGDRAITCLITSQDGQPLTGSARNSKK